MQCAQVGATSLPIPQNVIMDFCGSIMLFEDLYIPIFFEIESASMIM